MLHELFRKYASMPVLFLSSGGSALDLLGPELKHTDLSISVLDEHYVKDERERNFHKLSKLDFFTSAIQSGARSFDPYRGAVQDAGKAFNGFLQSWIRDNPSGKILCTVGMGADGHTAGIVPFADEQAFQKLFCGEALAVGYKTPAGDAFPERLTSTYALLRHCSDVILYAVGEKKAPIVQKLMSEDASLHTFPAMFLKQLPQVTLFTDVSAPIPPFLKEVPNL